MKISGIIPARFDSSRFPGKPLIDIEGKSMIRRVYEQAAASGVFHELIVATDDDRIAVEVKSFGGQYQMTAPHHRSGTDRCAEVAARLTDTDIVINIQGDEPLLDPEQIRLLARLFRNEKGPEIGSMALQIRQTEEIFDPNVVKVVMDKHNYALYFSRNTIPFIRGLDQKFWPDKGTFFKHIGMYGFRKEVLMQLSRLSPGNYEQWEQLEQLRWLENGFRIQMALTTIETIGVDVPADLERVGALLRRKEQKPN